MDLNALFRGRKAIVNKLTAFGFKKQGEEYVYREKIVGGQFTLTVTAGETVRAEVYDNEAESPYYLYAVEGAEGTFVGEVRAEYERVLNAVSENCFQKAQPFREKTAQQVIAYAKKTYGTPLEFLWETFPQNAVLRRKDNAKWYAVILTVKTQKLGLSGEGDIEVIDMLAPKEEIPKILDGVNYLPAYHMNKKSWLTVPLDGRVNAEIICAMLDMSYSLAAKKK